MTNGSFDGFPKLIKLMAQKSYDDEIASDIAERLNELKEVSAKIQSMTAYLKDMKGNITSQSKATSTEIKTLESELKATVGVDLFAQLIEVANSNASTQTKGLTTLGKLQSDILHGDIYGALEVTPSKAEQKAEFEKNEESSETVEEPASTPDVEHIRKELIIGEESGPPTEIERAVVEDLNDESPTGQELEEVSSDEVVEVTHDESEVEATNLPDTNEVVEKVEAENHEVEVENHIEQTDDAVEESEVNASTNEGEDENEDDSKGDVIRPRMPRFRRSPRIVQQ